MGVAILYNGGFVIAPSHCAPALESLNVRAYRHGQP